MEIEKLIDTIQDCNLNFLIGSGLSMPYLPTLGNIELLVTDLNSDPDIEEGDKEIIRCSILGKYFDTVIKKNKFISSNKKKSKEHLEVLANYKRFLLTLNAITLKRKSTLLNKQINLFTTNIDVFLEKSLEVTQVEFNDGFSGRFHPIFNLSNFKKSVYKKSLHYDNTSEIPVFNLLKVHGSLTWIFDKDRISYSNLDQIDKLNEKYEAIKSTIISFEDKHSLTHFTTEVASLLHSSEHSEFLDHYNKLAIVNPNKEKFQDTLLNVNYYELLRLFSNELEKENTILFVLGFSISDEHIREILLRAANSNPTLLIKVFAYDENAKDAIDTNLATGGISLRYDNIEVECLEDGFYDFQTLNEKVFTALLNKID